MRKIDFNILRQAWKKLVDERQEDLLKIAPNFTNPSEIYIKKIEETDDDLLVQFTGFQDSTADFVNSLPQAKRAILTWLKRFSTNVQIQSSDDATLVVRINKELQFDEAAVSIFKRNPKTNKIQRYYKCVGGKKDGRKVKDAKDCIGVPDWNKKMKFGITKRAKYGQVKTAKTKTKLTNIISKKVSKANARVKAARGF